MENNSDLKATLIAFGVLLFLNLLSLLLVYVTPWGKEYIADLKKNNSKGYFIFWNIWMCLVGVTLWPTVGIGELIKKIRLKQEKK